MTVIDLTTQATIKPKRMQGFCRCQQVNCIEETRQLECQQCGRVIDPFDWLWKQALNQESAVFDVKRVRAEHERLVAEVDDLKRQRRNLKAQIKRAKETAE